MRKSLLSALLSLFLPTAAGAYDVSIDDIYYNLSTGEATVAGCLQSLESVVIPESITSGGRTYAVTGIVRAAFNSCQMTSVSIPGTVTKIADNAFVYCSNLREVAVPAGVKRIEDYTFYCCFALRSITLEEGLEYIGTSSFNDCYDLAHVEIPATVTSVSDDAFENCYFGPGELVNHSAVTSSDNWGATLCDETSTDALLVLDGVVQRCRSWATSADIPDGVTAIGREAFDFCYGLESLSIPGSVKEIAGSAFNSCIGLTSLTLAEGVETIGAGAFGDCYQLKKVVLPASVKSIGWNAFNSSTHLCAGKGTDALLALWESGLTAYDAETEEVLAKPGFGETYKTQTTIAFYVKNLYPEYENVFNYEFAQVQGNWYQVAGLAPDREYTLVLDIRGQGKCLTMTRTATTRPVEMEVDRKRVTNLTISAIGYYDAGDAVVTESGFEGFGAGDECTVTGLKPGQSYELTYYVIVSDTIKIPKRVIYETIPVSASASGEAGATSCQLTGELQGVIDATVTDYGFDGYPNQLTAKLNGLDPETAYNRTFHVTTEEGGTIQTDVSFTTLPLTLTTLLPKVISEGNVIVSATSNIDDDEVNVGFEWRRTDWTDEFDSKSGGAFLYDGQMEGYIRSLNSNYLWKFRPFYTSLSGTSYYGDWKGMDPSDYSWFEPTVHTYAQVSVQGNSATVRGYAMRGTEAIVRQGFMYWAGSSPTSSRQKVSAVPASAKTVLASGNVMTATIDDLEYETTYSYVAFVTTSEGETFYGQQQSFSTNMDPDGILDVEAGEEVKEVARYDAQGRRLQGAQRGLNIIRYSDGSTRKVVVR